MEKQIKAIFFDFDGVLADTMEDNFLAWERTFRDFGIGIEKEDYFILEGMKLTEVANILSKRYSLDVNPEEIVRLKNDYYLKNHSFSLYEGVEDLINLLRSRKIAIGMVSASPKEKLDKTIPKEFLGKFNCVISGDDTERGKPNPDPYLKAAQKLNLNSEECLVIENAPLGIKAAKAAGMHCIAIGSTLNKNLLKEADVFVDKFRDLMDLDEFKKLEYDNP